MDSSECCRRVNPFRLCSALRFIGYFMLVLVAAIVALSYYAVVVVVWGPRLVRFSSSSFPAFVVLVLFHLLLVMIIWSYVMVVFRDPGHVPENWRPVRDEENLEAIDTTTSSNHIAPDVLASPWSPSPAARRPEVRYCSRCQNHKPPRCHHCSICQKCVLKMDHHCVWVVNCVGAGNYKFFLLFLLYTFLETVLDTFALLPHFIKFFGEAKNHSGSPGNLAVTFVAFVLSVAFALSLLCFVVMHTTLLLSNTTSIEVYEKRNVLRWKYDMGKRSNFEQVFGTKKLLWFLPLYSKEDLENIQALRGLEFPVRADEES